MYFLCSCICLSAFCLLLVHVFRIYHTSLFQLFVFFYLCLRVCVTIPLCVSSSVLVSLSLSISFSLTLSLSLSPLIVFIPSSQNLNSTSITGLRSAITMAADSDSLATAANRLS